ncbi:hypothetical protein HDV62DRAFT_357634 [Trichoderma sp. SZMC 28011]
MTLTHNDCTLNYWIYKHVVEGLPPESKCAYCPQSVIVLAFLLSNTAGSRFGSRSRAATSLCRSPYKKLWFQG